MRKLLVVVYIIIWVVLAIIYVNTATLISLAIPLLLSMFPTVLDELVEKGENYRGEAMFQKGCVSCQSAFVAFYFLILRGILFPGIDPTVREELWIPLLLSLLFAIVGAFSVKTRPLVGPIMAGISFSIVLYVGMHLP